MDAAHTTIVQITGNWSRENTLFGRSKRRSEDTNTFLHRLELGWLAAPRVGRENCPPEVAPFPFLPYNGTFDAIVYLGAPAAGEWSQKGSQAALAPDRGKNAPVLRHSALRIKLYGSHRTYAPLVFPPLSRLCSGDSPRRRRSYSRTHTRAHRQSTRAIAPRDAALTLARTHTKRLKEEARCDSIFPNLPREAVLASRAQYKPPYRATTLLVCAPQREQQRRPGSPFSPGGRKRRPVFR